MMHNYAIVDQTPLSCRGTLLYTDNGLNLFNAPSCSNYGSLEKKNGNLCTLHNYNNTQ